MKYVRLALALIVGVVMLVACQNPHQSPDPGGEDPLPEEPAPSDPDPGDPPSDPEPEDPEPEPPTLTEQSIVIDFEQATPGIVAEAFAAAGTAASPASGQLDADAWSITGFSDGDVAFGQEVSTGDVARGPSDGGETIGGVYAFTVAEGDVAMGVQPTSSDFAPGSFTLTVPAPSNELRSVAVACRMWTWNDQGRATDWSVDFSTNGSDWIALDELAHATPADADAEPAWIASDYSEAISLEDIAIADGTPLYLRWTAEDGDGSGSRDESALDNVTVTFTYLE
jgi:hypothetical protein